MISACGLDQGHRDAFQTGEGMGNDGGAASESSGGHIGEITDSGGDSSNGDGDTSTGGMGDGDGTGGQSPMASCGDGMQDNREDCDDGNTDDEDGCTSDCEIEDGWTCPETGAPCVACRISESIGQCPGWYCSDEGSECIDCTGGPTLDCPCTDSSYPSGEFSPGDSGCNGAAQKLSLRCEPSTEIWVLEETCAAGQNCEQSSGKCKDIVDDCEGQDGGHTYCAPSDVRHMCDADLVNTSSMTCAGVCSDGMCQMPRCGDGKIQSSEVCDDGNDTPADGCEPASSSAACEESGILKVAGGRDFTCALLVGGHVRCWGNNEKGQLGVGNTNFYGNEHPKDIPLVGLSEAAVDLSVERFHACVVTSSGAIECWGDNSLGQLGQGTATPATSSTPERIDFGTDAVQVATGGYHACARLTNGSVRCWGDNAGGQLGIQAGGTISVSVPATSLATPELGGTAQKVVVADVASCALLADGNVRCWGGNFNGQLGLGLGRFDMVGDDEDPEDVSVLAFRDAKLIQDLADGTSHFCGVGTGSETQCWGRNGEGQLGVSDKTNVGRENLALASGKDVQLSEAVDSIDGGGYHTCAITTTEALQCWGSNQYGQLGIADINGDNVAEEEWGGAAGQQPYKLPNLLGGGLAASQVSLGFSHTCALSQNGEVRCWGRNESGQLGLGYVSSGGKDHVGKIDSELPSLLPAVEVLK